MKTNNTKNSKSNNLKFKNKDKKVLMLIDSHALLHRGYHAMSGFATRDGRPTGALFGFLKMILNARNIGEPDYVVACYDLPKPTFRHIAYAEYKGTRTRSDEDLKVQINQSKDFCHALGMPICEMEGFEADDMLGTIAELYKDKYNIMIVSGDMDTLQLVDENVKVATLKKGSEIGVFGVKEVLEKYELTPLQIPDYKGLSGDPSDNIPGVAGIGPKTAIKVLKEFKTVENLYECIKNKESSKQNKYTVEDVLKVVKGKAFESIQNSEEEATFSKTLATIRRDAPIDKKIFYNFEKEDSEMHKGFVVDLPEYERLCNLYELHSLKKAFSDDKNNNSNNKSNSNSDIILPAMNIDLENIIEKKGEIIISERELSELQVMSVILKSEHINLPFEKIKELHGISDESNYQQVKDILLGKLKEENSQGERLLDYYNNFEQPLFGILENMRSVGILIDTKELGMQKENIKILISNLQQEIYKLAGEEFLISSPKQLGVVLYDNMGLGNKIKKTASGARSTNADMLDSIKSEHEIVGKIINFREMSKVFNTYIEPLDNYILEDGRVHPHFLQAGASTGRFSCENPNMQNLPRNSELGLAFRKVFVSAPDKVFISADYSQIDLRSAAMLSQDEKLIDIFKNNIDVHKGVAAQVLNKNLEDVTDEERRKAKAINFGILYGMGVNALRDAMGVERAVAQEFYDNFKSTFSTLMNYLDKVKLEATQKTYTTTLFGRRRDVPLLASNLPFMRAQGERIAINAPIQGTSADILKLGMINVNARLEKENENKNSQIKMLLQIHDELVFECDADQKDYFAKIIKEELEKVIDVYLEKENIKDRVKNENKSDLDKNNSKDIKLELINNIPLIANVSFGKSLFEL